MEDQLVNTPLNGFPLFSSLPPEVRDQIWETAATPPKNGVNYFSVHHCSTKGVLSNCVRVHPLHVIPTQRGSRLLPPTFNANDTAPLTRSWFNGNPSTYNLSSVAFACKESRAAFIRMAKRLEKCPGSDDDCFCTSCLDPYGQPRFTALTARQGSERVRIHLRLQQDLIYLKFDWNTLSSSDGYLDPFSLFRDPIYLSRGPSGHPNNIAIELAPSLLDFGISGIESKWSVLSGLINSWLGSGSRVWVVNRPEETEPTVLSKSCTSLTRVFRDTSNRGYITIPLKIYHCSVSSSKHSELSWRLNAHIGGNIPMPLFPEYSVGFGLLFLQEDLKFR